MKKALRNPDSFEARLAQFLYDRFEEARAVRVGEKEISDQAAIVKRYAYLFTRAQLESLAEHERQAESRGVAGGELDRLSRLRRPGGGGIVAAELAAREDALENELLAARLVWKGEE